MKLIIFLISFWGFAGIYGVYRFGPGDGFMCHCKGRVQCDQTTGNCSSGCSERWFGPGCQYRDLAQLDGKVVSQSLAKQKQGALLAVDGNENTCSRTRRRMNPFWKIRLPQNETITELYIKTDKDKLQTFKRARVFIEYVSPRTSSRAQQNKGTTMSEVCYDSNNIIPTDTYFVFKCTQPLVGNQIKILIEDKVTLVLCDVRINGGRNLAFGKRTNQSSTLHDATSYNSSKAVDGDLRTRSYTKRTQSPTWSIFLDHEAMIQHIRLNYKTDRPRNFETMLLPGTNIDSDRWLKQQAKARLVLYQTATGFKITGSGNSYLELYEVGLFGDCTGNQCGFDCKSKCQCNHATIWNRMSTNCAPNCSKTAPNQVCEQAAERVCDNGFYGTQCTKCGKCLNNEACDKTSGKCPSGCQPGYEGDLCTDQCPRYKYGQQCLSRCSTACQGGICNHTTGNCDAGCSDNKYGIRCDSTCNANCLYRRCNQIDGNCENGWCKGGWQGSKCENECSTYKYGQQCASNCNTNCKGRTCDHVTGKCDDGCNDGWQGDMCKTKCPRYKYGQQCKSRCSTACQGGICNHTTGNCDAGCSDNKYGIRCDSTCNANCLYRRCNQIDGNCENGWCKDGWQGSKCENECSTYKYGQQCASNCNTNCKGRTCDHVTGKCDDGCNDGWQGDMCKTKCPKSKYGPQCYNTCSTTCKTGACNHVNGKCDGGCKDGWQGDTCKRQCPESKYGPQCYNTCSTNCKTGACNHVNGKCDGGCKDGWHGDTCRRQCPRYKYGQQCLSRCSADCKGGICNHVTGNCDGGCSDNKYGIRCDSTCNDNCFYRKCNQIDGNCEKGWCKGGWQGSKCENECSTYKYGQQCASNCNTNCKGRTCDHVTGKCDDGCNDGWQGDMCKTKCPKSKYGPQCYNTCSTTCKTGACNHVHGKCDGGCKDGWQGDTCKRQCPKSKYGPQCHNTCSTNCKTEACNHVNGKCDGGCKEGWQGDTCRKQCPRYKYGQQCLSRCSADCEGGICNHVTGNCDGGCSDNKYGIRCDSTCNANCFYRKCNQIDGNCEKGWCKDGWQGSKCENECSTYKYGQQCASNCNTNCKGRTCDHVTGKCDGGCNDGWQECPESKYGPQCNNTCSTNCKTGACNHVNGKCDGGCKDGWQGDTCKRQCPSGQYGNNCEQVCSDHCKGATCNHVDGKCEQGCTAGFHGQWCQNKCENGKWGHACKHDCGNCFDGTCDSENGRCGGNCSVGYKLTSMCDEACDGGFHGTNCSETCGRCNNGSDCNRVSGECPEGCSSGYSGNLCLTYEQAAAEINIPVGIGAGAFLLLVLVLIVLFVKLGRKKRTLPTDQAIELRKEITISNLNAGTSQMYEACSSFKADGARSKTRVQVSKLLQFVKQNLLNKEKLISEFKTIPYGLQYAHESAKLEDNVGKNRYKEIFPYDHSRVTLTAVRGVPNSDYVNASFIRGHFRENAYIAAQGPTEVSVADFWRMIWEKDIQTIAMLTNPVENMKVKCIQYWRPPNIEQTYGNLIVLTESEHIFAEYTIRRFKVVYKQGREHDRTVTQFHYTAWPDKGVPRSTSSLVHYWNVVRQADSLKTRPWLVHCSAGVGRTGTFIAMDLLYDQGEDYGTVDVRHCVQTLREQRLNMVQTKEQYKFLHGLMVEMLVLPSKQIHLDAYSAYHQSLQTIDSQSGKSALLLQYEGLQNERAFMDLLYDSCKIQIPDDNGDRFAAAKLEVNKSKNRYKNLLPANEFRPFLMSNVPGCTNYINAVYVQSYCNMRGYILTQTPMKETAIDCLRLVIEEGVKVIVTFNCKAKGIDDVGEYLPPNGTINLGPFTCTKIDEKDESSYVLRTHKIFYSAESQETTVYQLMFKNWPTQGIAPSDSQSILAFLQAADFYNRREAGKAIIVQCLNGAERSGLFVVLMNIIEHIRYESRVSIPHLVRCARVRREQVIPNFEQYKFCHDVLMSYVESNTTYANM